MERVGGLTAHGAQSIMAAADADPAASGVRASRLPMFILTPRSALLESEIGLVPDSSMVEHPAVNRVVEGSSPSRGDQRSVASLATGELTRNPGPESARGCSF